MKSSSMLLDLDGTLSDNSVGISRCIQHALTALGAPAADEATLRGCVGPPLRPSLGRLLGSEDADLIEQAIELYRVRYRAVGWQENVMYQGIPEALAELCTAGAGLYLCTAKPQPFAERIVAHFGLGRYLRAVYGAALSGSLDDKGTLMRHLLGTERLRVKRCVMIGDREHDMHAARANGVTGIGVLWGFGTREELEKAGAQRVVADPQGLVRAVREVLPG